MKRFGEKLRALRSMRSLTLKQLAGELGYATHAYLSEIESGRKQPTAELVLKVARRFEITTDCLLKDEMGIE